MGNSGDPRALDPLSVAVNYFPDLASYEEREVVEKIIVEAQKRILHMGAPRVKIKQEIMRDLEQLESTDAGLRLALSPLKNCLKNNTIENYTNLALVTNQLADSLEATGTADDSIMHKLRQINEKLIKLSS